jgi:hypothetical protein
MLIKIIERYRNNENATAALPLFTSLSILLCRGFLHEIDTVSVRDLQYQEPDAVNNFVKCLRQIIATVFPGLTLSSFNSTTFIQNIAKVFLFGGLAMKFLQLKNRFLLYQ